MIKDEKLTVRDLKGGDWYWMDKAVIQQYTPKVGAIGIAVYNFLASLVDSSQRCFPSQKYIAESLGYSRATVNKALSLLKTTGLIGIEKRSRYHCVYYLLKVRCHAGETEMSSRGNSDVNQEDTNDNKLTRMNNNIDIQNRKPLGSGDIFKGFRPRNKRELLALDLAEALNDHRGLALYLSYSKKYPEPLLRKVLGEVKEIPFEKIRKSRAALFNHLIQKYAQKTAENPGDQSGDKISGDSALSGP